MLIISKFTDYYDHFSKIYGEDPNVVFDRRIKLDGVLKLSDRDADIKKALNYIMVRMTRYNRTSPIHDMIRVKILVYCGDIYLLASKDGDNYRVVQHGDYFYNKLVIQKSTGLPWPRSVDIDKETNHIRCSEYTSSYWNRADINDAGVRMKLHDYIPSPYFIITNPTVRGDTEIFIDENVPNLGALGFSTFNEPFDVYKEVNEFILTHSVDSPDKAPPVEVSNKDKITKHGFDTKISFRGKNK